VLQTVLPRLPFLARTPAPQGMLSIGCALLGAGAVLGLEVDEDALHVARRNLARFDGTSTSGDDSCSEAGPSDTSHGQHFPVRVPHAFCP
jgi:ribosomal protein L11 methylase PrmA